MMAKTWPSDTRWRQVAAAGLFLALWVSPLVTQSAEKQSFDPQNVKIHIEHGIELPWGKPGFRIEIGGWRPNEALSIHAVGPSGEKVDLVPLNKPVYPGKDGTVVIDIDYARKGLKQGHWMLLIGGKPGVHITQTDLPFVEAPTESNPKWKLTFGNSNGKDK